MQLDEIVAAVDALQSTTVNVDEAEDTAKQARIASKGLWEFAMSCEAMVHVPTNDVIAAIETVGLRELRQAGAIRVVPKEWIRWIEGRR